ncbi:TPA: hypothetical protein DEP58_04840 [Patescibacteria group bacterium]|nr:MAG: Polysaccharide deacetylase [Parcubacteria group bacterium GW2011_GWD2_42_14]HCC05592.1 hypothetical protein [Patescibacteria group bacterium]
MGVIGLPYFAFFPWFDVFMSLILLVAITITIATHGLIMFLVYLSIMLSLQALMVWYACRLDEEKLYLVWYSIFANFYYSHLLNYITLKAGISYLLKREISWGKLVRTGVITIKELTPYKT